MVHTFMAGKLGLAITMVIAFSSSSEYSADSVRVAGYEQINDEYAENSCGNGILPESIPCKNVESTAKGDKNIVNIEGIVFP
jgi:hypothetical protein